LVDWDADERKDLIVGHTDGTIKIYLNVNTDENPQFDGGTFLQVGSPGSKINIDVGSRATPKVIDWNDDGKRDLVVGALDGQIRVYINEGTGTAPDYRTTQFVQEGGSAMVVPSARSSPEVLDLDEDGRKDILTNGQLVFYSNAGTDAAPTFSGYEYVEADGVPIDLPGTPRSRPYVCDWTEDGFLDVLVGAGDGLVRLYSGFGLNAVAGESHGPAAGRSRLAACPNPFSPGTTFSFVLNRPDHVRLSIYDVRGQRVALPVDGTLSDGEHRLPWSALGTDGEPLSPGVYFARMETSGGAETMKLLLLR